MILIAGPCAAENRSQVLETAKLLAASGIRDFRAGVWKPRSKPGCFEGAGEEALQWMKEAADKYQLRLATEVATAEHVALAMKYHFSYLWLGARTTTNPFLVQEIADALKKVDVKPIVLVKNPLSPDVNLWLGAIERIADAVGMQQVVAVHRGFQTGQPSAYRNNPCWSVVFALRERLQPCVQLLMDASHMAGDSRLIPDLCQQAMALKYDGFMLESHCLPEQALSDANQQLAPKQLASLIATLQQLHISNEDQGLAPFRAEIDELDENIWELIQMRMQVSKRIGEYKRLHDIPVVREARYEAMLKRRFDWARNQGLSEDFVRLIMETIHTESCRNQK